MAEPRELILTRLVAVIAGVTGIMTAVRNQSDIPVSSRPGVIVNDGAEEFLDAPRGEQLSRVQRVELSPQILILVRADSGAEAGTLLTLFRNRIVNAVLSDTTLRGYVGTVGGMRFEGCAVEPPAPESKEPRMDVNIVFTYTFKLSALA
jgi:hypothetical protein